MSTPRSGFRRAAATSWTLAGLGIAGVAGASALAYADTVKPALRRQLIGVGGAMVSDHHARCNHCQSALD